MLVSSLSKVSVIITTYNVEKYILFALDSVLRQSYKNIEIIIVDDCSSDNTKNILENIGDSRIKIYFNENNKGPSYSRNKGIEKATGKYVAILDSDDWWEDSRLEKCIEAIEKSNVNVICDDINFIIDGEVNPYSTLFNSKELKIIKPTSIPINLFINKDLGLLKPILNRDFIIKNNIKYAEEVKYGEDFLFLLEVLRHGEVLLIPKGYYNYREREGSLVRNSKILFEGLINSTTNYLNNESDTIPLEVQVLLKSRLERHRNLLTWVLFKEDIKRFKLLSVLKRIITKPKFSLFLIGFLYSKLKVTGK
ncbi:glycosyltransferase family 2 protein [Niallia sp. MER 6]|uniref:glycosyltransferase family 2 protein n=1 Tax=Niallia sp. MER 6 TaxID=2939567 RepID=UPI00203DEB18|nr:glycosyltransferase family 2 protein [Niallia sp. MER 6]MCM3029813.1 glycosyltransferase family 2 protein [Niallia sp. MER 6]